MTVSLTHSESISVSASPDRVYDTVSDVIRTGEWSPVCRECWWDEGGGAVVGAYFTGRNVTPDRTWETRSEVVVADPGREFSWSVAGGRVVWTYSMQPEADGASTRLTESWDFTPEGQEFFVEKYGDSAAEEIEKRRAAAFTGIPETLAAIKRVVESGD